MELNKKYSSIDKFIMGIGAIILLVSIGLFFFYAPSSEHEGLEKIAEIKNGRGDQKVSGTITWIKTKKNGGVYNGDEIFANQNQDIVIDMGEENTLVVTRGALVRISLSKDSLNLNIQSGQVKINAKKLNRKLKVKHKGVQKTIKLSQNTQLNLDSSLEDIKLDIVEGEASLGAKTVLKAPKTQIKFVSPSHFDIYPDQSIKVKWQGHERGERLTLKITGAGQEVEEEVDGDEFLLKPLNSGKYNLSLETEKKERFNHSFEVSFKHYISLDKILVKKSGEKILRTVSFKNFDKRPYFFQLVDNSKKIVIQSDINRSSYTFNNLLGRDYSLKVIDKEKGLLVFETILENKQFISPLKPDLIYKDKGMTVGLHWKLSAGEKRNVQVKVNVFPLNSKEPIFSTQTSENSVTFDIKSFADLKWEVVSLDSDIESTTMKKISISPPPPAKVLVVDEKLVMKWNAKFKCYQFKLPSYSYVKRYYIEVFDKSTSENLVFSKWSGSGNVCWQSARDGKFFYRYRYLDNWGRLSDFSKLGAIIFPISPLTKF